MPIKNGTVVYSLPKKYKDMIDRNFLLTLRKELHKISGLSLGDFYCDKLLYEEGTAGWMAAFGMACILTKKEELYLYSESLASYDYDIFCSEINELMVKNKLVLSDDIKRIITKELGYEDSEVEKCYTCGDYYHISDMSEIKDTYNKDTEDEYIEKNYVCYHCQLQEESEYKNANNYYREALKTLEAFNKK